MNNTPQASRQVLQHFLLGFDGTSLPDELRELLRGGLAGVAIYPRNFTSVEELRALTTAIRDAAGGRVLIGIDQEGGTKFSLPEPFTPWPSPAQLGRRDTEAVGTGELTLRVTLVARPMARELRAAGVNLNFAPMLDLHVNPSSPVTSGRSFGSDVVRHSLLGATFVEAHRAESVLTCAKHFPGHGDANVDPHVDLPVIRGSVEQFNNGLAMFLPAIRAGVSCVMTAHILVQTPGMANAEADVPASLSYGMLGEQLRRRFAFAGAILADDLGMGAIRKRYGAGEAAVKSIEAGTDIVMLCHDRSLVSGAIETVQRACDSGAISDSRRRESGQRITRLLDAAQACNEAAAETPLDLIGCAQHRRAAEHVRQRMASAG